VWIKALPAEHMARVVAQGDLRPMQGSAEAMEDLNRILQAREPLYRKADLTFDTVGERPEQSLAKLRQAVSA
jgi:XRE family aerobic/anaerobic benzoate catabolism transcriptional regulator